MVETTNVSSFDDVSIDGEPQLGPSAQDGPRERVSRIRVVVIAIVALLITIATLGYSLYIRAFPNTDDARIEGNIITISSRVPGTLTEVAIEDGEQVSPGQLLARLDPKDLSIIRNRTELQTKNASALSDALAVGIALKRKTNSDAVLSCREELKAAAAAQLVASARLREAQAEELEAKNNEARAAQMRDMISQKDYESFVTRHQITQAALEAAGEELTESVAKRDQAQVSLDDALAQEKQIAQLELQWEAAKASERLEHQNVLAALRNLSYTTIVAPSDGIVQKKEAQVGEVVQTGQPLLAIVSLSHLWVSANYKETQLAGVRVGQKVRVHVDALGTTFNGYVRSIGGAAASMFDLLPPEDSNGNYVKIVQRIPVRIDLEGKKEDLARLRPGMSVEPTINTTGW